MRGRDPSGRWEDQQANRRRAGHHSRNSANRRQACYLTAGNDHGRATRPDRSRGHLCLGGGSVKWIPVTILRLAYFAVVGVIGWVPWSNGHEVWAVIVAL